MNVWGEKIQEVCFQFTGSEIFIESYFHNEESAIKTTLLEEGYQYALRFIQARPFPTLNEVRVVLDEFKSMPKAANAKPEQFIDLTLVQELEKEKFFDRLK